MSGNITTTISVAGVGMTTRPERAATTPLGLWSLMARAWTGNLDRRIEADLRWLDHAGVQDDYRVASRG